MQEDVDCKHVRAAMAQPVKVGESRGIDTAYRNCRRIHESPCAYLRQEVVHSKGLCMVAEHLEGVALC